MVGLLKSVRAGVNCIIFILMEALTVHGDEMMRKSTLQHNLFDGQQQMNGQTDKPKNGQTNNRSNNCQIYIRMTVTPLKKLKRTVNQVSFLGGFWGSVFFTFFIQ